MPLEQPGVPAPPAVVKLPRLVGVVHLPPLPGSPLASAAHRPRSFAEVIESAARDAEALVAAGFDGVVVENFGDKPFFPDRVPAVTIAAMTACALAVAKAAPGLSLGVNVLRNDARAALAIAVATGASFVRVNVHTSARLTDQGVVSGRAHETMRERAALGVDAGDAKVAFFCDVDVKHAAPLAPRPLVEEVHELADRALADAVLVTGSGTGERTDAAVVEQAARASSRPVYVASGVTAANVREYAAAYGLVVGSVLRADGRAGGPVDAARAKAFVEAARAAGFR